MDYKEAVRYADSFINYEKTGYGDAWRNFKLGRMERLAGLFGNPERSFPSVHITGTKGKGSVASFTAGVLKSARFKVGLYTSPHLIDPRERIRIDNDVISEEDFAFYASLIKERLEREDLGFMPSFFEIYTLLAFNYFRAKKIDYGVIEVGLGGRLDSTNIVRTVAAAISPVSYDHTNVLGETLEKIAREKCGIIKTGSTLISAPQEEAVLRVIREECAHLGVPLALIEKDITFEEIYHDAEREIFNINGRLARYEHCESRLVGRHQIVNAATAIGIAEILTEKGARISNEDIKKGIGITENPGRCEIIAKNPYIVTDGAQNRASAKALKETIRRNFRYRQLILVMGISKEKDIPGICYELAPLADAVILTKSKVKRAEEPDFIAKFIKGKKAIVTGSVGEAMEKARAMAGAEDMILVTGSFFVIAEAK